MNMDNIEAIIIDMREGQPNAQRTNLTLDNDLGEYLENSKYFLDDEQKNYTYYGPEFKVLRDGSSR